MLDKVLFTVTVGDVLVVLLYALVMAAVCKAVFAVPAVKKGVEAFFAKLVNTLPDGDVKTAFELLLKKGL